MSEIIVEPRKTFKNISHNIIDFLKKLSYDGYVLAGHCASNIMTDTNIRNLNFFIYKDFIKVFKNNFMFNDATYKYYDDFIEIESSDMLINLIYYEIEILTPYDIIKNFDFSHVKSFISSNDLKIHTLVETLECLATKIIHTIPKNALHSLYRFGKAKNDNYIFSQNIINTYPSYFKNNKLKKEIYESENYIFKTKYGWFVLKTLSNNPLKIIKNYNIQREQKPIKIEKKEKLEEVEIPAIEEEIIIPKRVKKVSDSEEDYNIKYLDDENYIVKSFIPNELKNYINENFEEMFLLHPEKKHEILLGSEKKNLSVHRYQKNYGLTPPLYENNDKSYMYSNSKTDRNSEPEPPEIFKPLIEYINKNNKYNQFIINWYEIGDYIAEHSDCCVGMIEDFEITTLHIIEDELYDDKFEFKIIKKPNKEHDIINEPLIIPLKQGEYISMGGKTFQKLYNHGVEKGEVRRINISFRQFIQ